MPLDYRGISDEASIFLPSQECAMCVSYSPPSVRNMPPGAYEQEMLRRVEPTPEQEYPEVAEEEES